MELRFPLILDGATGTELQKCGYTGDVSAEQWTLSHPEAIRAIQRDYVAAGSQVLYTPTFGGNAVKLAEHGVTGQTADYNRRLAALSREASGGRALLAGDLAPTGLFLSPLGSASFDDLVDAYAQQVSGLEEAGVDLYVIETMMTLSDARAAVLAVRAVTDKPIFVTFTCDRNGRSISGTDITAALTVLQGMGIDAFGLNCSAGPEQMLPQLRRLREYARIPLIAKPNAGMPTIVDGRTVYDCPPEQFVSLVPDMLACGVMIFGGCCGTTAAHSAALRAALDGASVTPPAPRHTELLPAATEKLPCCLPADAGHGPILSVTPDLEDALAAALEEDFPMTALRLTSPADAAALAECQYMLTKPLCLVCDDAAVLEQALRVYQGRALYEGALPEDLLRPLAGKYGLLY